MNQRLRRLTGRPHVDTHCRTHTVACRTLTNRPSSLVCAQCRRRRRRDDWSCIHKLLPCCRSSWVCHHTGDKTLTIEYRHFKRALKGRVFRLLPYAQFTPIGDNCELNRRNVDTAEFHLLYTVPHHTDQSVEFGITGYYPVWHRHAVTDDDLSCQPSRDDFHFLRATAYML